MAAKHSINRLTAAFNQTRSYSAPTSRSVPAAKQKYVPTSGTYPKGFLAGSAFAGVKASNTKYDDLALVVSETPCAGSAVFTQNAFKAAPVSVSKRTLGERRSRDIRGVVVNSGCANAVTGKLGIKHAAEMARVTDKCFGETEGEVPQTLVMSTGVIGQQLPIEKITSAIPTVHSNLGSTHDHWMKAAQAICTTDTFPKLLSRTFTLPSHPETTYSIAGMTKGAGMIHPNMATLLGIVCTDVKILPQALTQSLRKATPKSFNSISIDGDTSTNDTVALFANGAAAPTDVEPLEYHKTELLTGLSEDLAAFNAVLTSFMTDLAKLVVRDGEGATKFVTIRVTSDIDTFTAKRVAESIATSSLVKTALYGKDANWGRILCAIGYAPGVMPKKHAQIDLLGGKNMKQRSQITGKLKQENKDLQPPVQPRNTSVSFIPTDGSEELKLLVRGEPEQVDEERAKQILEMEDLEILVRLDDYEAEHRRPSHECLFWTCDFSHEYVTINGDYRT